MRRLAPRDEDRSEQEMEVIFYHEEEWSRGFEENWESPLDKSWRECQEEKAKLDVIWGWMIIVVFGGMAVLYLFAELRWF